MSSEAEPHPRASSIRTDQEVSVIPTISTEIKTNAEKRRNIDTDGEQIPCNIDPVSEDTEQLYNARDDDKDGVSGPDIGNHEKELEYTEHSMWAITKKYAKKTDITHKSSFKITSVTDTTNNEGREVESDSEEDNKETTDMPIVTLNTIVAENTDEKSMALNSICLEKFNKDSNPREKLHRTHIGKSGPEIEEGEAKENADTDAPAYSNNRPDGRNTVKTSRALGCDKIEDDHGSEPRLDQTVESTE